MAGKRATHSVLCCSIVSGVAEVDCGHFRCIIRITYNACWVSSMRAGAGEAVIKFHIAGLKVYRWYVVAFLPHPSAGCGELLVAVLPHKTHSGGGV